jgi:hypothetical protein
MLDMTPQYCAAQLDTVHSNCAFFLLDLRCDNRSLTEQGDILSILLILLIVYILKMD